MEENIKNDIINIIKVDTNKNNKESETIYKNIENNLNHDLKIISNSTNLDLWDSYLLYKKNNFNLINSLTDFEDPEFNHNEIKNTKFYYTEVEKKIQELRKIADLKDEYYEIIVKKN